MRRGKSERGERGKKRGSRRKGVRWGEKSDKENRKFFKSALKEEDWGEV